MGDTGGCHVHSRRFAALVLFALVPGVAAAQNEPARPKTRVDTNVRSRITNMREWVDSAASAPPRPKSKADSLASNAIWKSGRDSAVLVGSGIDSVVHIRGRVTTVSRNGEVDLPPLRDGQIAPATAGALPAITLTGVMSVLAGAFLMRGRRRTRDDA
jgi:hypothetical protein